MLFSESIILEAWRRSGGRCECTNDNHGHGDRCSTRLVWTLRGGELGSGWAAARRTTWGIDILQNCQILCARCQGPKIIPAAEWTGDLNTEKSRISAPICATVAIDAPSASPRKAPGLQFEI